MNYERIKSTILIVLIGISIILTWQVYTFQPEIALLDDTGSRYIPDHLNEEREERAMADVILPEQIIIHHHNERAMIPNESEKFEQLFEQLGNKSLYEIDLLPTTPFPRQGEEGGVEMIFPAPIPTDVFLSFFDKNEEEIVIPLNEVSRLFLYVDQQSERVHMQILSSEDERVVEVETSFSVSEFQEYVYASDEFVAVTAVAGVSSPSSYYKEEIYVTTEPVQVERLSFATTPLLAEYYKQVLFTDPSSVKYYQQTDGEDSYTDGNRIITMQNSGLFMEYINPVFIEAQDRSSKHIVQSGYEFINGHGGWTNDYYFSSWGSSDTRDEVTFLLHINGYPVINFEGQGHMGLEVSRSGTQIVNYTRPLFEIDHLPIDAKETIELPPGVEVIEQLKKQEFFEEDRLSKVAVGYEMIQRNSSFVTVEPYWFVLYGNRWQKVTFDEDGE